MANTFTRKTSRNIGTGATQVGSYTVAASTAATVIGMTVSNTTASAVTADVYHYDGANITYIVRNAPINAGGSLVPVGGDQKVVLITGDSIYVKSSAATSLDVVMSILEIT